MITHFIGDKAFYRRVLAVALPIMVQNGISNFVSLLDNIMVGQVGNEPMSGVSIVNGLIFVFNLCIFGACSGAGIFTAQYHGSGNREGVRYTFRFKLMICVLLSALGIGVFLLGGEALIGLYLRGEGDPEQAAAILGYGIRYLKIMLVGLVPFAITNAYASTLRETGETVVPMVAGIVAVIVNLIFNYILIFGHFGAPALGTDGAAVATVLSRFVELAVVAGWTHFHSRRAAFIQGAFSSMHIPGSLLGQILVKGLPLLANEFLWSSGMAVINQCYSVCSLDVVPAMNISNTLYNLSSVVFIALGSAVGIFMGQLLGGGCTAGEAKSENRKLIVVSVVSSILFGALMAAASGVFPLIYNTTESVRRLATWLILISAALMPFNAYTNATYFTLRSGGQTVVTFLFDSCFVWGVCVPLAFVLSRFTDLGIIWLFLICQGTDLIKCVIGSIMLRRGAWIRNLTA